MSTNGQVGGFAQHVYLTIIILIPVLAILFILDLPTRVGIVLYTEQYVGIFLAMYLAATFLGVRAKKRSKEKTVPWYDWILALLAFPAGLFITVKYPELSANLARISYAQLFFGGLAIVLILEALRRLVDIFLVIFVAAVIMYTRFAVYFPSFLGGRPTSSARLINYLYLDPNSFLWLLALAATIGTGFVFFGQILIKFGIGEIMTDLSTAIVGRVRGGSAKTAVVGSSMVGTITGAPMSNVILTGSITIPMMKKAGYSPRMAGAVEAVASAGGQLMPPVMGIAAFIIAENLGLPYAEIALAALFPAVLYYFAIFLQVDLEAGKRGLGALSKDQIPPLMQTIKRSWVALFPVGVIVYTLFIARMDPASAATVSGLLCLPIFAVLPGNRKIFWRNLITSFQETGRMLLTIGGVMTAAGLMVGSVNVSGLGFSLSFILSQLGQSNVLLLLVAAALASMVLGMGMPSVAAYALVANMLAPPLIEFGLYPLSVHLFVFYFSIISNFTPPIALTCFAAAPIANENPTKIGITAMRLGILAYIVPFLFVFSPTMLLVGSLSTVILSVTTSLIGVFFLSIALVGFMYKHISWLRRLIMVVAAVSLLIPIHSFTWTLMIPNAAGLLLGILVFLPEIGQILKRYHSDLGREVIVSNKRRA